MGRKLPLNRTRLHAILDLYQPGVTIEMRGGYDTGVYFNFKGTMIGSAPADDMAGGRQVRRWGFCSEALEMSRAEERVRGGLSAGVAIFMARCDRRREQLARWITEHQAPSDDTSPLDQGRLVYHP